MSLLFNLVWLGATSLAAQAETGERDRPNILIVVADDLGFGDLACMGNEQIHTPNLDRMAEQGTLFTSFYVASPTCSPSRASFLTGRFPSELGIVKPIQRPKKREATEDEAAALPIEVPNVPRLMAGAGYRVGHIGKWHLGPSGDPNSRPELYGFQTARIPFEKDAETDERDWQLRSTAGMVDAALEFVDEQDERPFYLQVWLRDPHAPLPLQPEGIERYDHYKAEFGDLHGPPAVYMACVTEIDNQIGRLMRELKSRGELSKTLLIFTSDNGPEVQRIPNASTSAGGNPGPFRGMKRSLYEGGLRVPLIARWPGVVPAGIVDEDSVLSSVDLLPTFLSMAGGELPEDSAVDGLDASSVFSGETWEREAPLFYEFHFEQLGREIDKSPMLAVRDGDWMLLCNRGGADPELYNVVADPGQQNNRALDEPDLTTRLTREVLAWFRTLGIRDMPAKPPGERWQMPGRTR